MKLIAGVFVLAGAIIGANAVLSSAQEPQVSYVVDTGARPQPADLINAVCSGVARIPQTALAGACGGRLDMCGAFNALATILANQLYACPRFGTVVIVTATPAETPTPQAVLLGGRDE